MSTGPSASVSAATAIVDLGRIGHVGRRDRDLPARRAQRRRGLVEHVGPPRDQRDPGAPVDREPRGREPDPTRSAGDEHVRILELRHARGSVRRVRGSGLEQAARCGAAATRRPIAPISSEVRDVHEQRPVHVAEHERPLEHDTLVERREPDDRLQPGGIAVEREERRREQEQRDRARALT